VALRVRYEGRCLSHTVHVVPRCRCPNPCLPQQQDTMPYPVKISVLRSRRWAKDCPKHVELILEINKLLLLHLVLLYLHWWRTVKHKSSFQLEDLKVDGKVLSRLLRYDPAWLVNGTSAILCPNTVSSGKICFRITGRTSKRWYTGVFRFVGDRKCEFCCVQSNPLQILAPLFSPPRMNITRIACETRLYESSYLLSACGSSHAKQVGLERNTGRPLH